MLDLIQYYEEGLGPDLLAFSSASGGDFSIVAFFGPDQASPGGEMQGLFHALPAERRLAFLFGYQFCVLLDQAIHDRLRQHHARFQAVARYPKLRGILGSYHTMMHPALLLAVAAASVTEVAEPDATVEFRRLSSHVFTEYARFLREDFAGLTGTPPEDAHASLVSPVFSALSEAYARLFRPTCSASSFPLRGSGLTPRPRLYAAWCDIVQASIHEVGEREGVWRGA